MPDSAGMLQAMDTPGLQRPMIDTGQAELPVYTPAGVALRLGLTPAGVLGLAVRGKLPMLRTADGRSRLYPRDAVDRLAAERQAKAAEPTQSREEVTA